MFMRFFRRFIQNDTVPEEIELQEIQPKINPIDLSKISLPNLNITCELLKFTPISTVTFEDFRDEFKRVPKKTYKNLASENNVGGISILFDDIWLKIFSYLDVASLANMIASCKKIAHIANDNEIRKYLYDEKQHFNSEQNFKAEQRLFMSKYDRFFKSAPPKPQEKFMDQILALHKSSPSPLEINFLSTLKAKKIYNDNPPNKGFVIK